MHFLGFIAKCESFCGLRSQLLQGVCPPKASALRESGGVPLWFLHKKGCGEAGAQHFRNRKEIRPPAKKWEPNSERDRRAKRTKKKKRFPFQVISGSKLGFCLPSNSIDFCCNFSCNVWFDCQLQLGFLRSQA